mmetsp:Transcript_8911/g.23533  ORF Transcript_8911/g.23533 Transcript_8911/m.23533 type:complete len:288 (+) Transcript_8911:1137-2000(+)
MLVHGLQEGGGQGGLQLQQAWERREVRGLHLDAGGVVVRDVAVPRQGGVDLRREVGVLRDNVLLDAAALLHPPLLLHLAEDLGPLPLAACQEAVALLLLALPHTLHLVLVGGLALRVPVRQREPQQREPLLLQLADLLLAVGPLSELLHLHQLHPRAQAVLIRRGRQHLLEEALLPGPLDNLKFGLGGREAPAEGQMRQCEDLRHLVWRDVVLGRERIRLRIGLPIHTLCAHGLGLRLSDHRSAVRNAVSPSLHGVHHNVRKRAQHLLVRPREELVAVASVDNIVVT